MKKTLLVSGLALLIYSCGGGGASFTTSKEVFVSAEVKAGNVVASVSDYTNQDADLVLSISSDDIFERSVYFEDVRLVYKDLSGKQVREVSYPLGFSLSTGQTKTQKITLFSIADKLSSPYIYLNPINPTTVGASYSEEVLARPLVSVLGQGECHKEQQCQIVNGQQQCQDVEVCKRDFSGTFSEDIQVGTCSVVAGNQKVEEKTFGILEGDGSGIVEGRTIRVSFNDGPKQGTYVVAKCLSKIKPLSYDYLLLKLVYGDALYETTSGSLLKDSSGKVVGQIDNLGNVNFYSAIGSKDYPLVAFYYHSPTVGGELIGYGNGGSTYRLRTRYAPVDFASVKVLAEGNGFSAVAQVQFVDGATGEITFTFPRPVPEGVPIYAQYRLTDLFQKIEIYVNTSMGQKKAGEVNLRVVK